MESNSVWNHTSDKQHTNVLTVDMTDGYNFSSDIRKYELVKSLAQVAVALLLTRQTEIRFSSLVYLYKHWLESVSINKGHSHLHGNQLTF